MKFDESFVDIFQTIIKDHYHDDYPSRKIKEIEYFKAILTVITMHIHWSDYYGPINWKVLHNKHMEYVNKGFYDKLFRIVYVKYVESQGHHIYKYQSIDTSFIINKSCSGLPRNKFYKSKRGVKISSINDINGIPLSLIVTTGEVNDSKIVADMFDNIHATPNTHKYKNANKYKQYFLADKGYDTNEAKNIAANKGYTVIIPQNRRNIKDPNKIIKLTAKQKRKYKNRIKVENYYAWIKGVPKLMYIFERSINNFQQLLFITTSLLIFNRFLV